MDINKEKKNFCLVKKTIEYVKKQPTDWENIIAYSISDNELIFKVHKQLIPLKIKQAT